MSRIFDSSTLPNAPAPQSNEPPSLQSPRSSRATVVIVITIIAALLMVAGVVGTSAVLIYRARNSVLGGTLDQRQPKTKLEAFQAKAGTVLVKSYSDITTIAGTPSGVIEIEAMELRDRSNGSQALGVVIDVKPAGGYAQNNRSFIDSDEIDSLLKGIDYISNVTSATPPLKNFEARYQTRGDFSVVTFNHSDGKVAATLSSGVLSSTQVFITIQDLSKLKQSIVSAKETLDKVER